MPGAFFHFHPDLNEFLTREYRAGGAFDQVFENGQSVKHLVEAAGVPHTEVGRVEANGATVDFAYLVQDGDRRLLMRKAVRRGYCLRSLDPIAQLREVVWRYALMPQITPFQRCLRCNGPLDPVSKAEVLNQLEPLTRRYYHEFHRCPDCGQVYWKGSHYEHMLSLIQRLRADGSPPNEG